MGFRDDFKRIFGSKKDSQISESQIDEDVKDDTEIIETPEVESLRIERCGVLRDLEGMDKYLDDARMKGNDVAFDIGWDRKLKLQRQLAALDEKIEKLTTPKKIRQLGSFGYLSDLIEYGERQIILDSDINLASDEESEFRDGIELDVEDLVIDGNGHSIDAKGKARIFHSSAKNITIKNITLKNGFCDKGGAIKNEGELAIINCVFENNAADEGGAINHEIGKLTITESTFAENSSTDNGGAIFNKSNLSVDNSSFHKNNAKDGGAICVRWDSRITSSKFCENTAGDCGGALHNVEIISRSTLTVNGCSFSSNHAGSDYCDDIFNHSDLVLNDLHFEDSSKSIFNHETCCIYPEIQEKIFNEGKIFTHLTAGERSFTYLDELIHGDSSQILLDCDIRIDWTCENNMTQGIVLDVDDIVIDGGGHTIDGLDETRIFTCKAKNVKLKNITLKNGFSEDGGAIKNEGELVMEDVTVMGNEAKSGAALYNGDGVITVYDSTIMGNVSKRGAAICNAGGNFKIFSCEVSHNKSQGSVVENSDSMDIQSSNFHDNEASHVISNDVNKLSVLKQDNSNLSISSCKLTANTCKSTIFNDDICTVKKCIFEKNLSDDSSDITNNGNMTLIEFKIIDNDYFIRNEGHLLVKKSSDELFLKIRGRGEVENDSIPTYATLDFTYLDEMIRRSDGNEIVLDGNISFENYEIDFYEGGIELDIDNLVIDGNGHSIDAKGKSRIFHISADNITLKNIIFRNGHSYRHYDNILNNNGGAIKNNHGCSLTVENCKFLNNVSDDLGGAILNYGAVEIFESELCENVSKNSGGAIENYGKLIIRSSEISRNKSYASAGAVYNKDVLDMDDCILDSNTSVGDGGTIVNEGNSSITKSTFTRAEATAGSAIYNFANMTIAESRISENITKYSGGAVYNSGEMRITGSILSKNENNWFGLGGGAIVNWKELTISDCEINQNKASEGGAIVNWKELTISGCKVYQNMASEGAAIYASMGYITISDSTFDRNAASSQLYAGGALYLEEITGITITKSSFCYNTARGKGGAIYSSGYDDAIFQITDSVFEKNRASEGGAIYNWANAEKLNLDGCTFKDNKPNNLG